jgi:hypothetical protein
MDSSRFRETGPMKKIEELPFIVVISRDDSTAARLLATRERAFNRHSHPFKNTDSFKKTLKADPGLIVSAMLKSSGECLGSVKIESNFDEQFYFEKEVSTPDLVERIGSICLSRLSVTEGQMGLTVRLALWKAVYLYAHARESQYVYGFVDTPRHRLYRSFGFEPAIDGNPDLILECHENLPMKLVRSEVNSFQATLLRTSEKVEEFFFQTRHPDIQIFSSVGSLSQKRRTNDFPIPPDSAIGTLMPTLTV